MIDQIGLSDLERLMLAKLAPEADREGISVGKHDVDVTLRLFGTVSVGKDHEAVIPAAVPWERVALLALSKLNLATREKIVEDALGEREISANEIKAEALVVADRLKGETKRMRRGPVRLEIVAARVGD